MPANKNAVTRYYILDKLLAERERMLRLPTPKYTASAPPCMAAISDSYEPTGDIISIFFILVEMVFTILTMEEFFYFMVAGCKKEPWYNATALQLAALC